MAAPAPRPLTPNRFTSLTAALDHDTALGGAGVFHQTVQECAGIMADIDAGRLCPIGVVLAQSLNPVDVFENHVALVYGYELSGNQLTLHNYDCNFQGMDDMVIQLDISSTTPAKPVTTTCTWMTDNPGHIRGFFRLPYTHADPSSVYVDDGHVAILTPPPAVMTPGQHASVTLSVSNTGSTTFAPLLNYRIGSQQPQDSTTWGPNRANFNAPFDPDQSGSATFTVTAPSTTGSYHFAWRPVRDGVHWFGTGVDVTVLVSPDTATCNALHAQHVTLAASLADVRAEIAAIDWSDPVTARHESATLNNQAKALQAQISALEAQQTAAGCTPG